MYDKILNPSSDVFDAESGAYIGKANFKFMQKSEGRLLDYLNYEIIPQSPVFLLGLNIYEPSPGYVAPVPLIKNKRVAAIYAVARDQDSGQYIPFVLRLRFETVVRGSLTSSGYMADSVEISNIEPLGIYWVTFERNVL